MDAQRLIALVVFTFSGLMLWEAWQKHNAPKIPAKAAQTAAAPAGKANSDVPAPLAATAPAATPAAATPGGAAGALGDWVKVRTDVYELLLNTRGGDIRNITLLKHRSGKEEKDGTRKPLQFLSEREKTFYITQTGLAGAGLPNHNSLWKADKTEYVMADGEKELLVKFTNSDLAGVQVTKTWRFKRGAYLAEVGYEVNNATAEPISPTAYFHFARNGLSPDGEAATTNPFSGVTTFFGPVVYTEAKKYQKIGFSDIDKGKTDPSTNKSELPPEVKDGWIGVVQHYFLGAWITPSAVRQADGKFDKPADRSRAFYMEKVSDTAHEVINESGQRVTSTAPFYRAGTRVSMGAIAPGASGTLKGELYAGPQETDTLETLAPGMKHVLDYGIFEILARPLFWVLDKLHDMVGNWGWAIILLTILIKTVFYPLNAKAGRSMAHMKLLAPKLEALRARYGDDRMKLNQATMELFKTEKVNPMGGCLPILVQIPVFIALYWVLLGAIELRQAPWLGWIQDLSAPDPYYVLPVLYAVSMFVQTKLNPQPTDPVQAKVMLFMPVVFSIFFFFFPAGLVLYWFVQNLIGIAQQWYINRTIAREAEDKNKGKR
jgi:YidC/Oxa1 family membrane protein insertase